MPPAFSMTPVTNRCGRYTPDPSRLKVAQDDAQNTEGGLMKFNDDGGTSRKRLFHCRDFGSERFLGECWFRVETSS
jgi:hypothetical protein